MKHVKLFENYLRTHDLTTLRDVVDPDHYNEEESFFYDDMVDAAVWIGERLGLDMLGSNRLGRLGLQGPYDQAMSMPLEQVVEVYNTSAKTWHDMPRFRALAEAFPGLFMLTEPQNTRSDLVIAGSARELDRLELGELEVISFEDDGGEVRIAIMIVSNYHLAIYMLDKDLEKI